MNTLPRRMQNIDVFQDIGVNLVASGIIFVAGLLVSRLAVRVAHRRLWRLSDPRHVVICVSQSAVSDTGRYMRPSTGVGQLRALALIAPSLSRAYRHLDSSRVRLATDELAENLERDLVTIGGSKNNRITLDIMERLESRIPARSYESQLAWRDDAGANIVYEATLRDGVPWRDFGLVIRAENPFRKGRTVVVLAGASTYGTAAAARYFVERCRWVRGDFVALVSAHVRDRFSLEPRLERLAHIRKARA